MLPARLTRPLAQRVPSGLSVLGRGAAVSSEAIPPARLAEAALPKLDLSRPPWPGREVELDGQSVHVRATPGGPRAEPALYVHGLGGTSTNWTDLAGLLAPWLAGEALDLPGFGRSGPAPDGDYTLAGQAAAVIRYLERSGTGPRHLIGNSMGGAVSIVVAANRPDLVRTLTLVSPAVPDLRPRRADPTLPLVAMPLVGPLIMRQVVRMRPDARVRVALALCFADPSRVPPQRLAEAEADVVYRAGLEHAPEAFVRALRGLIAAYLQPGSRSMWAQAAAVEAPTLIVWGRQDKLVDVALSSRLAAAVPQSRLLVLDDVGHVAQMEDPVSTARAVVALLEDAASLSVTR